MKKVKKLELRKESLKSQLDGQMVKAQGGRALPLPTDFCPTRAPFMCAPE